MDGDADRPLKQDVSLPAVGQDLEEPAKDGREVDLAQLLADGLVEEIAQVPVLHRANDLGQRGYDRLDNVGDDLGRGKPSSEALAGVGRSQARQEHGLGQETALDEPAKGASDPILVVREDGRVGDRQPERVAKERRDSEPVRKPANDASLGPGTKQVQCRSQGWARARSHRTA